jgi:hypothetical protein
MRRMLIIVLVVGACSVSCDRKGDAMRTCTIGSVKIDLPEFLETRTEGDTLVAFPPHTDFANIRFTVLSVFKDGALVRDAGVKMIRARAAKAQVPLQEHKNKVWYHVTESASQGAKGSQMHYWYVGMDGHCIVVSCFIDATRIEDPVAQRVLESIEPAIQSFKDDAN